MIDVETARTFLAIATTGTFQAAARQVNVTQSTVSARIKTLEERLGQRVFERSKSGAVLNHHGRQFERYARAIVQAWEQGKRKVAQAKDYESSLAIGGQPNLWTRFLSQWLLELHVPVRSRRTPAGPATTAVSPKTTCTRSPPTSTTCTLRGTAIVPTSGIGWKRSNRASGSKIYQKDVGAPPDPMRCRCIVIVSLGIAMPAAASRPGRRPQAQPAPSAAGRAAAGAGAGDGGGRGRRRTGIAARRRPGVHGSRRQARARAPRDGPSSTGTSAGAGAARLGTPAARS